MTTNDVATWAGVATGALALSVSVTERIRSRRTDRRQDQVSVRILWDNARIHREPFLEHMRAAFHEVLHRPVSRSLDDLARSAGVPSVDIYMNRPSDRTRASDAVANLKGPQAQMWQIASSIYPPEMGLPERPTTRRMRTAAVERNGPFDDGRRQMANALWRSWQLAPDVAARELHMATVDAVSLCWLETALSWRSSEDGRKDGLFQLGRVS